MNRLKSCIFAVTIVLSVFVENILSRCTGYDSPISISSGSGVIKSPRYPESYGIYENCVWDFHFLFTHVHYLIVFDVEEMQTSYRRIGDNQNTCTGHLTIYKDEIKCRNEEPFCNAYYFHRSTYCDELANKRYANCNLSKRGTLMGAQVKFTSDTYFYKHIQQKGFKLKYQFIDCKKASTTTTVAPTTTTTTPPTTSTTTSTTTTTTTSPPPTTTTTTTAAATTTTTTPPTTTTTTTTNTSPPPTTPTTAAPTTTITAPPTTTTTTTTPTTTTSATAKVTTTTTATITTTKATTMSTTKSSTSAKPAIANIPPTSKTSSSAPTTTALLTVEPVATTTTPKVPVAISAITTKTSSTTVKETIADPTPVSKTTATAPTESTVIIQSSIAPTEDTRPSTDKQNQKITTAPKVIRVPVQSSTPLVDSAPPIKPYVTTNTSNSSRAVIDDSKKDPVEGDTQLMEKPKLPANRSATERVIGRVLGGNAIKSERRIQHVTTSSTACGESSSGCNPGMSKTAAYTLWIVMPIAAALVIIAATLLIIMIKRRRKKESMEVAYHVGFENKTYALKIVEKTFGGNEDHSP